MSLEETGAIQLDDSLVSPEIATEDGIKSLGSLSWGRLVSHVDNAQFELTDQEIDVFIGRHPQHCDVLVDWDQRVSGKHCRIFKDCEQIFLENLSSESNQIV
jgi:hypothetical protein